MDHYRVQHSSSGNDDASLSLVPSGRYMVELSKFFYIFTYMKYDASPKYIHHFTYYIHSCKNSK